MSVNVIPVITEVVGTVCLMATVLYLSYQIRSQIKEARLAATRELAAAYRDELDSIFNNEENFRLYLRAIEDYERLEREDRMRAYVMITRILRVLELQHLHLIHGNIDPQFFSAMETRLRSIIAFKGMQAFWRINKYEFSEEFQVLFEYTFRLISDTAISFNSEHD